MKVLKKIRIANLIYCLVLTFCLFLAIICISVRIYNLATFNPDNIGVIAAKIFLPQGHISSKSIFSVKKPFTENDKGNSGRFCDTTQKNNSNECSSFEIPDPPNLTDSQDEDRHAPDEKKYKIIESQFSSAGLKYENFYVKNISGIEINIAKELNLRPDVHIKNSKEPQVLIYHTHTSESYLKKDEGFFYESYYPRSTDNSRNITQVGEAITQKLIENGIPTIHDTTYHDSPTYKGSYSRSYNTIKSNLEKYPSIQVTIDVHRDSMGDTEHGKIKPTFKINGNKAAQIMVVAGCDPDGSSGFPDWEYNLRLALRVHQKCESMFPGLTRPLSFGKFKYNMNLSRGSMLIEFGSDVNTLKEAIYSGTLVGEALSRVLNELKD